MIRAALATPGALSPVPGLPELHGQCWGAAQRALSLVHCCRQRQGVFENPLAPPSLVLAAGTVGVQLTDGRRVYSAEDLLEALGQPATPALAPMPETAT